MEACDISLGKDWLVMSVPIMSGSTVVFDNVAISFPEKGTNMSNLHTHAGVSLFQFSAPSSSSSSMARPSPRGHSLQMLSDAFTQSFKSGARTSVFSDSITSLCSALRLHGIRSDGLSVIDCQEALICHFVSGNCFSNSYRVMSKRRKRSVTSTMDDGLREVSTCSNIASGFASQEELSSAVLHMIVICFVI
jgi:hypothetical protein